jgi:heterotetrameric sarcosine oxidase delta subunit
MMLIPCPWCGPRDETEFHYGGQADVSYPAEPASTSDEEWARFLFFRDNPKGVFAERWSHAAGCRRWFNLHRDTVTNTILPDQNTHAPTRTGAGADPRTVTR